METRPRCRSWPTGPLVHSFGARQNVSGRLVNNSRDALPGKHVLETFGVHASDPNSPRERHLAVVTQQDGGLNAQRPVCHQERLQGVSDGLTVSTVSPRPGHSAELWFQ